MNSKNFRSLAALNFLVVVVALLLLCPGGFVLSKIKPSSPAPMHFEEHLAARIGQEYTRDTHNSLIKLTKSTDRIAASSVAILHVYGRIGIFLGAILLATAMVSFVIMYRIYNDIEDGDEIQNGSNLP